MTDEDVPISIPVLTRSSFGRTAIGRSWGGFVGPVRSRRGTDDVGVLSLVRGKAEPGSGSSAGFAGVLDTFDGVLSLTTAAGVWRSLGLTYIRPVPFGDHGGIPGSTDSGRRTHTRVASEPAGEAGARTRTMPRRGTDDRIGDGSIDGSTPTKSVRSRTDRPRSGGNLPERFGILTGRSGGADAGGVEGSSDAEPRTGTAPPAATGTAVARGAGSDWTGQSWTVLALGGEPDGERPDRGFQGTAIESSGVADRPRRGRTTETTVGASRIDRQPPGRSGTDGMQPDAGPAGGASDESAEEHGPDGRGDSEAGSVTGPSRPDVQPPSFPTDRFGVVFTGLDRSPAEGVGRPSMLRPASRMTLLDDGTGAASESGDAGSQSPVPSATSWGADPESNPGDRATKPRRTDGPDPVSDPASTVDGRRREAPASAGSGAGRPRLTLKDAGAGESRHRQAGPPTSGHGPGAPGPDSVGDGPGHSRARTGGDTVDGPSSDRTVRPLEQENGVLDADRSNASTAKGGPEHGHSDHRVTDDGSPTDAGTERVDVDETATSLRVDDVLSGRQDGELDRVAEQLYREVRRRMRIERERRGL